MNTIICHSFPAWDTPYVKSTLELITRMSNTHRVIFLDYPYTLKDVFQNPHAPKKEILKGGNSPREIRTDFGFIEVYNSAPVIPVNWIKNKWGFRFMMKVNAWIQSRTIKKILKKVDLKNTVLINAFNPVYGYYTKPYWKEIPLTYYSYDNLEHTEWASKWGKKHEEPFIGLADRVVVSSEGLRQKFLHKHNQVVCIKNGVNLEHFSQGPIEKQKSKKLGYLGAFDNRIDLGLLKKVAESFSEHSIEVLGRVKVTHDLPSNVVFLGSKPQEDLAETVAGWDVALIPFVKNEFTKMIYPLKINEYLATGIPVVTTEFSDLSDFKGIVRVAKDQEGFLEGIRKEIKYNNRLKISKRKAFASQNSWESRSQEFLQVLAS